ncbi:MAG TPA: GNAT family N-acetyltransferase [Opitutaceae bacterium]|nr:GNAT family N-acetyltransferase [Opitutaceae bacterium]
MREYVAAVYGWEDSAQRRMFEEKFDPARIRIIQVDGHDAGLLEVEEREDHLFLSLIEVLPAFQKKDIGSAVIRSILADASRAKKGVFLQVLRPNPARIIYERLGFSVFDDTATHHKMKSEPNQAAPSTTPAVTPPAGQEARPP